MKPDEKIAWWTIGLLAAFAVVVAALSGCREERAAPPVTVPLYEDEQFKRSQREKEEDMRRCQKAGGTPSLGFGWRVVCVREVENWRAR